MLEAVVIAAEGLAMAEVAVMAAAASVELQKRF